MKKKIAVLLAFMLGFAYYPSEIVVMAAANEEKSIEAEEKNQAQLKEEMLEIKEDKVDDKKKSSFLNNMFSNFLGDAKEDDEKTQVTLDEKTTIPESSGLKNIQIPQKLNVVIDPWEMDKKGQVYSEEYTIRNIGDTSGILTLSGLSCKPRKQSGVIIRTDTAGIHDSGDKAIYMEMVLGSGERIVFSQDSSQYQTELKPGEELSIYFTGEVNENALGQWKNNDVVVSAVYSWKTEEELNIMSLEIPEDEEQADAEANTEDIEEKTQDNTDLEEKINSDLNAEELTGPPEEDIENGNSEEQRVEADVPAAETAPPVDTNADFSQENSMGNTAKEKTESEAVASVENGIAKVTPDTVINKSSINDSTCSDTEKDEIKKVDLREPQKVDVVIKSWKIDDKGKIISPQYLLENTGDTAGIWTLSELKCEPIEQSKVAIKTERNELHKSEEKSVYMELIIGNGKKIVLSQEQSQYNVELKPGEKLSVCFVGEMNGNLFEANADGEIEVTAVCIWNTK